MGAFWSFTFLSLSMPPFLFLLFGSRHNGAFWGLVVLTMVTQTREDKGGLESLEEKVSFMARNLIVKGHYTRCKTLLR